MQHGLITTGIVFLEHIHEFSLDVQGVRIKFNTEYSNPPTCVQTPPNLLQPHKQNNHYKSM